MTRRPYKAKTLSGAQARVRQTQREFNVLLGELQDAGRTLKRMQTEQELLARLAAEGPAFDNPLVAYEAKKIRDEILKGLHMKPDGSYLP